MIEPHMIPPPAGEPRQPEASRALELGASTGSASSSVEHLRTTLNGVLFAAEAEYQKKTGKTYVPKYANLRVEVSYQLLAALREALPNVRNLPRDENRHD